MSWLYPPPPRLLSRKIFTFFSIFLAHFSPIFLQVFCRFLHFFADFCAEFFTPKMRARKKSGGKILPPFNKPNEKKSAPVF